MNSSEERVSIIIPTHNREQFIRRAIRSVINQSYKRWELIVVDDASKDNTETAVANFCDERICYVRSEANLGQALATNLGISKSTGEYIAFLDDDDEWLPDKLASQLKVYREKPALGMVYCGMNKIRNESELRSCPR